HKLASSKVVGRLPRRHRKRDRLGAPAGRGASSPTEGRGTASRCAIKAAKREHLHGNQEDGALPDLVFSSPITRIGGYPLRTRRHSPASICLRLRSYVWPRYIHTSIEGRFGLADMTRFLMQALLAAVDPRAEPQF